MSIDCAQVEFCSVFLEEKVIVEVKRGFFVFGFYLLAIDANVLVNIE
jgi:hypothetical protein